MLRRKIVTDLLQCRAIWQALIEPRHVSDLWEFRVCFQRHYKRRPCFILLEDGNGPVGMLPLCYVEEEDTYVFFPGEIWKGRSWLERTPLYLREAKWLPALLDACPRKTYLRYLEGVDGLSEAGAEVDEIGYLLHPPDFGCDLSLYLKRFSTKRLKNLMKEINRLKAPHGIFQVGRLEDFDLMIEMNLQRFQGDSYFFDRRFAASFQEVMHFLHRQGWLRMVSLEVQKETLAVDLGAIYGETLVIFMGGTHLEVPGLAKAMNMAHLEFAFDQRLARVDFLCGDFHWKKLWHLDEERLYRFLSPELREREEASREGQGAIADPGEGERACESVLGS